MIPVILSGGSGSRLWPVSRAAFPKQFCELLDESLFAKTVRRLAPLGSPWVVTVREMKPLTERSLGELGVPTSQVIYEPFGKNTAPALALLCLQFERRGFGDEIVGLFPADHLVDGDDEFRSVVRAGIAYAEGGEVVTLGIQPTYPATGYGYIATDGPIGSGGGVKAIGFREKPNEVTAREFLNRGGFYWNAGMFIFRVRTMIELFKTYAPDIWASIAALKGDLSNLDEVYAGVRSTSVDYALMERLPSHVCLPCQFGWSDLGSWDSVAGLLPNRERESATVEIEAKGNFIFPQDGKVYAFVGVNDLMVVDTPDAVLVTRKGESELVKQVVDRMKSSADSFLKKRL